MKTIHALRVLTLACALGVACTAAAQDSKQSAAGPAISKEQKAMMDAMQRMSEVRPEHKQLDYFVGDWSMTTTMYMDPKAPPQKSEGKSHNESLYGGRYVKMHNEGSFQGQPFSGEGLFGFDNLKGKFFSTWIDSMSTGFWLVYGIYDAARKTYTFTGTMDHPTKAGAKIPVREVIHIVDTTHYTFDWYETRAGKEAETVKIEYLKH